MDITILLADDDVLNRLGLKSILNSYGFQYIFEASDGQKAVALTDKLNPDLLIFDISMPIMDGLTALEQIYKKRTIPTIIVSAYYDEHLIKKASELGVNYYLIKPILEHNLKIAIEITLSKAKDYYNLQQELDQTKESLSNRIYIEKAKGILMKRDLVSEPEAMKILQKLSNQKNKKLIDVARIIVEARNIDF